MLVKCYFCKSDTNKVEKTEAVVIDGKNFHAQCAKKYKEKKELYETICRIFKLKAPGPRNNAYISKFSSQGMTYKGMNNSLIYFYDIKKNNINKSNGGIGIIPWVYEEAQKYFYYKEKNEEKRLKAARENSNYVTKTIILNNSKEEKEELPSYLKPLEFIDAFENEELE